MRILYLILRIFGYRPRGVVANIQPSKYRIVSYDYISSGDNIETVYDVEEYDVFCETYDSIIQNRRLTEYKARDVYNYLVNSDIRYDKNTVLHRETIKQVVP